MKERLLKLLAMFFLAAAVAVSFTACNDDDDDDDPVVPEIPDTEFSEVNLMNDDGELVETIVTIKDHGKGIGTTTLASNKTWVADGMVFVNEGQVLTIEAGTILKGKSGQGENASAFIVARGAEIMAEGTANNPIIFTAEADGIHYDHVEGQVVTTDNLPPTTRGLWGGLILLGKATSNNTTVDNAIEGIPTNETRGLYGGDDDADNSGVVKYVSIRYGGTDIGEGNEINGLTFGCVGSNTTIDYVEVMANKDDGFEWFGSTVTCTHLISAFNGDDSFDYDESFRGNGQFWFVIQDPNQGDRIGEHDGGPKDNEFGEPYAIPHIYNVTYIGRGADAGKRVITFRDNAGGKYVNSIFANQAKGIDLEWLNGSDDSYQQWTNGNLEITNNIFWNVADGTPEGIFAISGDDGYDPALLTAFQTYFNDANNAVADPGITYAISQSGGLNPVPANDVSSNMASYPAGFSQVNYKGAFDPAGSNWAKGWTLLDHAGFLD